MKFHAKPVNVIFYLLYCYFLLTAHQTRSGLHKYSQTIQMRLHSVNLVKSRHLIFMGTDTMTKKKENLE
jgi:hypothetical protein